jgi:TonB family protein
MRPVLTAALAAAALAAPVIVIAQGAPYDVAPNWLRQPTNAEVEAVKPTAAIKEGLDGRVVLKCLVTVQGALTNCSVDHENPPGKGFGAAALTLTTSFQMRPAMKAGKPVEAWVMVPINMSGSGARPTDSFIRGQTTAGMRKVIRYAPWTTMPTFDQIAAAYPAKAKAAGRTGRAVEHCRFAKDGTFASCTTSQEEPVGFGFGAAARQLVANFRAPDAIPNLGPVKDVEIDIPFTFSADLLAGKQAPMTRPAWIAEPDEAAMRLAFPAKAMAANVGKGSAILACTIGPQGGLADCAVTKEEPQALGFGEAALDAARFYRVRRWTDEGLPTLGQSIRIAVGYDLPPTELAALKSRRTGQ